MQELTEKQGYNRAADAGRTNPFSCEDKETEIETQHTRRDNGIPVQRLYRKAGRVTEKGDEGQNGASSPYRMFL